jgi:hypothetical protein
MQRRDYLAALAGASGLLAGCAGSPDGTATPTATPTGTPAGTEGSLPDGIYVQPFRESMAMQGTASAGDLTVAFMYTTPHRFWTVTGSELSETPRAGNIHGMAVVWDAETGRVVPETGLSLEIERDGELVSQEVIYPMLSQRMGYHYGGNFRLDGDSEEQSSSGTAAQPQDGEYTARVSVGAIPDAVALTGAYEGRFREPRTVEIGFAFDEEQRERIGSQPLDAAGQPGAVRPMSMEMVPQATAPARDSLPGTLHGTPNSDDALLATGSLSGDAAARVDADSYLYVSARTRYNELVLPAMAMEATVTRGGEELFAGELTRTFDPDLGYHYGAGVGPLEAGDEVTLAVTVPPQVSRHEGYERAFLQMPDVTVTV